MAERTVAAPHQHNGQQHDGSLQRQEETRAQERYVAPPVDIYENGGGLIVVADLPGVTREGLDIEVKGDLLTIQARTHDTRSAQPIYQEFELVSYYRQFQLADTVDTGKISAELKHGVLTLRLPKAEEAKPRRIEIAVGE